MVAALGIPAAGVVHPHGVEGQVGRFEGFGGRREEPVLRAAAVAAGAVREAGCELVGAPSGAPHPALEQLVAHRVGERLHRVAPIDCIAVQVEEGVELVEAPTAVPSQQGQARGAQAASVEAAKGVVVDRRQRWLVVVRGAAAVTPLDTGPELVAQVLELVEDLRALRRERLQRGVDPGEVREEGFAAGVELVAHRRGDACGTTDREVARGLADRLRSGRRLRR